MVRAIAAVTAGLAAGVALFFGGSYLLILTIPDRFEQRLHHLGI